MKNLRNATILSVFLSMIFLNSCSKGQCPATDANGKQVYDNQGNPIYYDCSSNSSGSGSITSNAGAVNFSAIQAYADFDHDRFADVAGANTVAGGGIDYRYRAIRLDLAGFGYQQETYALILDKTLNDAQADVLFDKVGNFFTSRSTGKRVIWDILKYQQPIGGMSFANSQTKLLNGPLYIYVTGYRLQ
jgi:hypothetical protein